MKRWILLVAVSLLSACGGGSDSASNDDSATPEEVVTETPEEAVEIEGLTTPSKLSVVPVN